MAADRLLRARGMCGAASNRTIPAMDSTESAGWERAALLSVVEIAPCTFRLVGELDLSSVGVADAALVRALPVRGDLTLDLSGLSFMDSTGLHLLIRMAQSLSGDLVLQRPRPHVSRILEVSRVTAIPNVVVRTAAPIGCPSGLYLPRHSDRPAS
jgi:anti-anti-sigma factor